MITTTCAICDQSSVDVQMDNCLVNFDANGVTFSIEEREVVAGTLHRKTWDCIVSSEKGLVVDGHVVSQLIKFWHDQGKV